jgi:hypothetical protein
MPSEVYGIKWNSFVECYITHEITDSIKIGKKIHPP